MRWIREINVVFKKIIFIGVKGYLEGIVFKFGFFLSVNCFGFLVDWVDRGCLNG